MIERITPECVLFVKKMQQTKNRVIYIKSPLCLTESETPNLAQDFNKKLVYALRSVKDKPYFNKITIFIPDRLLFFNEFLYLSFYNLNIKFRKHFLKKKIEIICKNSDLEKKVWTTILKGKKIDEKQGN